MHVLLYRVRGARATPPPSDRHPSNRTSTRFALPLALIHAPMPCGSVVEPIVALITRSLAGCCALSRCWRYLCRPWETRRALLPCPCVANASLVGLGIWMHVCMHTCMCERMRGDKTIDWLAVAQLADTKERDRGAVRSYGTTAYASHQATLWTSTTHRRLRIRLKRLAGAKK
ncbi:hypothetical protein BKA81DRAFT_110662 [Phyllosticta paracitricarpa]